MKDDTKVIIAKIDALNDKVNKVDTKIDFVEARTEDINTKMAVYNEQLKVHIKRSTMLEELVNPIRDHVNQVRGAGKFLVYAGIVSTILTAVALLINRS